VNTSCRRRHYSNRFLIDVPSFSSKQPSHTWLVLPIPANQLPSIQCAKHHSSGILPSQTSRLPLLHCPPAPPRAAPLFVEDPDPISTAGTEAAHGSATALGPATTRTAQTVPFGARSSCHWRVDSRIEEVCVDPLGSCGSRRCCSCIRRVGEVERARGLSLICLTLKVCGSTGRARKGSIWEQEVWLVTTDCEATS
jgi:hypothetical protein